MDDAAFSSSAAPSAVIGSPPMAREKSVKIGAEVVRHARYVIFQLDEVAIPGYPARRQEGRMPT
jgi:hypothetical protein